MDEKDVAFAEWKKAINGIRFVGCENIAMGDVLHYVLLFDGGKHLSWKKGAKAIVRMIIRIGGSISYEIRKKGSPDSLFLFSNSSRGRSDHQKAFDDVTKLVDNYIKMTCSKHKLNPWGIKYLTYPIRWNRDLKVIVPQFGLRMHLLSYMFQAFMDFEYAFLQCRKYGWEIKNLITYCDVMPVDSFFVQRFNAMGGKTVTLQHGVYSIGDNTWAYLGSKSTYFFADSPYSVQRAKQIGYHGSIIAVGSPHHLATDQHKKQNDFEIKTIGVFLNSDGQSKEIDINISMLRCIQSYCEKNEKRMFLKFHPNNNIDFYKQYIDTDITTMYATEIFVSDFADMIDVAIVSTSTVFTTMLRLWKPVLIYEKCNYGMKMFPNTEKIRFSNEEGLIKKIQWIYSSNYREQMEQYRNYFLSPGDIKDNYRKAFSKIEISLGKDIKTE